MSLPARQQPDPRALLGAGAVVAGRYRVRRVLAVGGMGVVYQVVSLADGQPRAMKAMLPAVAADELLVRRFEREARAMRRLDHPGVIGVIETVSDRGAHYLVMPLIPGVTLDKLCAGRALAPRRALLLVRQVLDALEHAHGLGIIHRDLKPQNLLVVREQAPRAVVERLKILDFGIAKIVHSAGASGSLRLTQSGYTHGTPAYMAPEQARRTDDVDHRADLYAVGVILFELLTGARPFAGADDLSIMRQHLQDPPPWLGDVAAGAPWCVAALELVVATALAKDPARRYQDAAGMRRALDQAYGCLEGRGLL